MEVHRRKAWSRPKSDYGSRFYARRRNKHRGEGGEAGGLETLVEHEGSTLGSGEGVGDQSQRKTCEQREGEYADLSKVGIFSDLSAQQIVLGNLSLTNQNQGDGNGLNDDVEGGEGEGGVEDGGDRGSVEGGGDRGSVEGGGDGGSVEGGGDGDGVEGGDEGDVESGGDEGGVEGGGDGGGMESGGDEGSVEGGDEGGVEGGGDGGDVEGRGDGGDDKRYEHSQLQLYMHLTLCILSNTCI